MSSTNRAYGPSGQAFTITLTSIASGQAREGTVVNFSTATGGPYEDVLVFASVALASAGGADEKAVYIYAYGSVDGGTTYPDTVTGSDASITLNNPTQLPIIGAVHSDSVTTLKAGPFSLSAAFGFTMPTHAGVVVQNRTGSLMNSGTIYWQGVYTQTT